MKVSETAAHNTTPHTILTKQQRLLSRVALVFAGIITIYICAVSAILPGITPAKLIGIVAAVALGVIFWLSRYPKFYRPCAIGMVTITLVAGFGASLSNGGLEGYVAPILITAPIAAALFLGARATFISAATVVIAFCSLLSAQQGGLVQATPYPEAVTSIAALIMLATATAICAGGLGYFAADSEDKIDSLTAVQNKLVETADKLQHAAHHDVLTGIANRQKLHEHLSNLITDQTNQDSQVCLIHIDLDKFKEVNDTHGHPVGDGVLRKAAHIMQKNCGANDLVARVGGDEFVIVASKQTNETANQVQIFCEKLIEQISRPILVNGVQCEVGASIGYVASDTACCTVDSLVKNADIALYESKRAGRGVAREFTTSMRDSIELQRSLVSDLKHAFSENRITCVLQPQICLRSGKLLGIEALGRIRTKTNSLMPPADFLQIMEDIKLIDAFDTQVMREALDALVHIRDQGFDAPSISVNASAKSLRSARYVEVICQELSARGLTTSDIVVEVLESILIEDCDDSAAKTIEKLSDRGIKTVMDDFGSGHASMGSLLQLKIDGIKVDRSLIENIECERSRTVVEAVLALSKGLDLPAVVEGVETPRQYAILQSLGCEAAQGFGICRPVEVDGLTAWLEGLGSSEVTRLQSMLSRA